METELKNLQEKLVKIEEDLKLSREKVQVCTNDHDKLQAEYNFLEQENVFLKIDFQEVVTENESLAENNRSLLQQVSYQSNHIKDLEGLLNDCLSNMHCVFSLDHEKSIEGKLQCKNFCLDDVETETKVEQNLNSCSEIIDSDGLALCSKNECELDQESTVLDNICTKDNSPTSTSKLSQQKSKKSAHGDKEEAED